MPASAACDFPSPVEDYLGSPLDFNELLMENPPATFAVKVAGGSLTGIGLFAGDIATVNRAKTAVDQFIVVAVMTKTVGHRARTARFIKLLSL